MPRLAPVMRATGFDTGASMPPAGGVAILAQPPVEGKRGGRIPKQSCLWIVVDLYTKVTLAYGTG